MSISRIGSLEVLQADDPITTFQMRQDIQDILPIMSMKKNRTAKIRKTSKGSWIEYMLLCKFIKKNKKEKIECRVQEDISS